MKLIVLGDIHGNYYALEEVIYDALSTYGKEISGFIFNGDYVGDFPDGSKVIDLMQSLSKKNRVYIVSGNRETEQVIPYLEAQEKGKEPDWDLDTTMGAALLSCRGLSKEQIKYLSELPDILVIREKGLRPLFIKHKNELDETELKKVKDENMAVIMAHTHESYSEVKDGIPFYNPGSVGLSDDGIPGATYGVLESTKKGDWKFTIRDIPYDFDKTIKSLKDNKDLYVRCCGWGKALELSVLTGINCTSLYANEANRLAALESLLKPTKENYDAALKNTRKAALLASKEKISSGRHKSLTT